ncbi:MAG: GNAT family N-acetyltransferase [Anaerolineae bacterium]|nr:GNAT family N-acetyltransferase [Anaerolineae bacterium]
MTTVQLRPDFYPSTALLATLRAAVQAHSLAQHPALATLPGRAFNVVARADDGELAGGAVVEVDAGWHFLDTLWVAADRRGQGLGRRLLSAVEQVSRQQGVGRLWLMTTDFQALPFYRRAGYTVLAQQPDRPPGHTLYYLARRDFAPAPLHPALALEWPPHSTTTAALAGGLIADSAVTLHFEPLALCLHTADGALVGGLAGNSFWNWFDLRLLWIAEAWRGQGQGTRLLHHLIGVARARGLTGISTDLLAWQGLPFFRRQGFQPLFTLPDRPAGQPGSFVELRL